MNPFDNTYEISKKDTPVDMVNHPPHYTSRDMECWDWYELIMTKEEFCGHMKGLICKYLYRIGGKWDDKEDLEKIIVYTKRWIEKLDRDV